MGFFSSCSERGLLSSCSAWASHRGDFPPCGARGLGAVGFSRCSSPALEHRLRSCAALAALLCGMWDLPESEVEPMSPTWPGRFFAISPPGKPATVSLNVPKPQWMSFGPRLYGLFCLKLLWVFHQLNVLAEDESSQTVCKSVCHPIACAVQSKFQQNIRRS